jgi:transcription-repair coupling factor (superfamily II helicase)
VTAKSTAVQGFGLVPSGFIEAVATAPGALEVAGAPEGLDAAAFAEALIARGGVGLFVARDEARAAAFDAACQFFAPFLDTLRLPAWDTLPYDRISPTASVAAQRCAALAALAVRPDGEGAPVLVISTASGVAQRVPPRARLAAAALHVRAGSVVAQEQLNAYLAVNGYVRASTVRVAGEFAARGGVLDVFPPGAAEPVRFDFFGDTLESVRAFDPETQRTTRQLARRGFRRCRRRCWTARRWRTSGVGSLRISAPPPTRCTMRSARASAGRVWKRCCPIFTPSWKPCSITRARPR